ncbi:TIGR00730 family Rossman fold protein [Roseomonas eburnea]|uniref:Cytokinin riboside 5'-monophosphate phosphoribohydrolase n=1 Tax=Neoroseomonas eburnea TaxID=1346889 RepID=A0A9X9XDQ9_9PROT|nr:TIGR00730 family Rossman fold protein [Neoroseomonas eburnea]MBR0681845.1 TIGR00730 family Rossman fold protein [Neoroseomonas eburnea]
MHDNGAQKRSRSFLLAVEDQEFLLRDEMRPFRFGMEYAKAEYALRDWGVRSTVVVFGSARVPSPEEVQALAATARSPAQKRAAKHAAEQSRMYEEARAFARIVSLRGGALAVTGAPRDNVIATGGGPGIMEAANRGAAEAGAPSIGFNITLPHEQNPNAWSTPALTFRFHYFAMRKMHLAMRANALAVFPGGFGTFDELFELLTLVQTNKASPRPIVLFGRAFWENAVNFPLLVEHGMIDPKDLELFEVVDSPEEAWASLVRRGLEARPLPAAVEPPLVVPKHRRRPEQERMKPPVPRK